MTSSRTKRRRAVILFCNWLQSTIGIGLYWVYVKKGYMLLENSTEILCHRARMKKEEGKTMEAEQLADRLLSATNANQISSVLGELKTDEVIKLATTILPNGHTLLHLLAQREKLHALHGLLLRGVGCLARDGKGATPLHMALQHNCLLAARLLIEEGGANVSEVITRKKGTTLLHRMVACDRPQAIKLLLEKKVNVNARDLEGRTPFHLAAVLGNCAIATLLFRHEQCDVNAYDDTGHSALMLAIMNDNLDLAILLVDCPRVDVLQRVPYNDLSALHLAVTQGQLHVVRALLRRNSANLHCKEKSMGRAPIHLACALVCCRPGMVSSNCFLHNDYQYRMERNTALQDSAAGYHEEENAEISSDIELLLQGKTMTPSNLLAWLEETENRDFTVRSTESGQSSLPSQTDSSLTLIASQSQSPTGFPIQSGSQTTFPMQNGSQTAFPMQNGSQITFSMQNDNQPHQSTKDVVVNGHQPLSTTIFCKRNSSAAPAASDVINGNGHVEFALKPPAGNYPKAGASRKQSTPKQQGIKNNGLKSQSPLNLRTKFRSSDVPSSSKLRTRHSISGDTMLRTPRPQTSTSASAAPKQSGNIVKTKCSIMRPATAPAHNRYCTSSSVSFAEHEQTVSELSTSRHGVLQRQTSIRMVVTPSTIDVVRCKMVSLLLDHGADANLMTSFRKSPLHIASMIGATNVMAVLLPRVTNINVMSAHNKTALHLALDRGHEAVAEQLVHAGINLALRDVDGLTALHIAARYGFTNICGLLLSAGASIDCTDFKQMTPIHHAFSQHHCDVVIMLKSAGARLDLVDVDGFKPEDYGCDSRPRICVDKNNTGSTMSNYDDLDSSSTLLVQDALSAESKGKLKPSTSHSLVIPPPAPDLQQAPVLLLTRTISRSLLN